MKLINSIIIITISVFTIHCGESGNEVYHSAEKNKAVVIRDNASVRIDPHIFSSRVSLLNKGAVVTIIDVSKEKQWVGGKIDHWYKIKLHNNIKGWIFGTSLALQKDASDAAFERYVNDLWKKEADAVRREIAGKWWSINKSGDFTDHALELYPDGIYKSYRKNTEGYEGNYSLNFKTNEVVFLDGTSFGYNLHFVKRGTSYQLLNNNPDSKIQFKKIAEFKDSMPPITPDAIPGKQGETTRNDESTVTN